MYDDDSHEYDELHSPEDDWDDGDLADEYDGEPDSSDISMDDDDWEPEDDELAEWAPEVGLSNKGLRRRLRELVQGGGNRHSRQSDRERWISLYQALESKTACDIRSIFYSKPETYRGSQLDIVEEKGLLPELYEIARQRYGGGSHRVA